MPHEIDITAAHRMSSGIKSILDVWMDLGTKDMK